MRIAYTGWTWLTHHKDNYRWEFEQFLKEVSYLGYDSVENFAFITDYFDSDADAVNALLKKYNLDLVNMYLHFKDTPEIDYEKAVNFAEFMKKTKTPFMNLQGNMYEGDGAGNHPTDEAKIKGYAELSNKIGKLCKPAGITPCFHPHWGTPVFTEAEIDIYEKYVDHDTVKLCIDTAHTALAGMDPVKIIEKYGDLIGYMHLKDLDPDVTIRPERPLVRFLPLGQGTIDFSGVVKALKKAGYDGVLCVELDNSPVCNFKSAMDSREYIRGVLHM